MLRQRTSTLFQKADLNGKQPLLVVINNHHDFNCLFLLR